MKITITLEQDFGHPDNRPTKEGVLKVFAEELPKAISEIKKQGAVWPAHWQVTAIVVQ